MNNSVIQEQNQKIDDLMCQKYENKVLHFLCTRPPIVEKMPAATYLTSLNDVLETPLDFLFMKAFLRKEKLSKMLTPIKPEIGGMIYI